MPDLPPWLNINPLTPVNMFLSAYGQGASIGQHNRANEQAEAQMALQQEHDAAAQSAQSRSADLAERHEGFTEEHAADEEQRLQEQAAYQRDQNERMAQLREDAQKIQQDHMERQLKLKEESEARAKDLAETQMAAQTEFQDEMATRMELGATHEEALREAMASVGPRLFAGHPGGFTGAIKATAPPPETVTIPPNIESGSPGAFKTGSHVVPFYQHRDYGAQEGRLELTERAKILQSLMLNDFENRDKYAAELQQINSALGAGNGWGGGGAPAPTKEQPIALPPDRGQWVVGQVYQLGKKLGRFTGHGFKEVQ